MRLLFMISTTINLLVTIALAVAISRPYPDRITVVVALLNAAVFGFNLRSLLMQWVEAGSKEETHG